MNGHRPAPLKQRFMVVFFTGFVFLFTGIQTWGYPPDYLSVPRVWAVVFVAAGLLAWLSVSIQKMWASAVSGGLLVGAALFRSAAIFVELGWQRWLRSFHTEGEPALSSSFSIAGMTWMLIGVLLWVGWPHIQADILGTDWEADNDE